MTEAEIKKTTKELVQLRKRIGTDEMQLAAAVYEEAGRVNIADGTAGSWGNLAYLCNIFAVYYAGKVMGTREARQKKKRQRQRCYKNEIVLEGGVAK